MREAKTRKYHSPEFKAKVGLEAVRGVTTINEIGQEYGVHPVQVGQWKKKILEQASALFEGKRGPQPVRPNQVWSTDITYIRLPHGFAYLVAIIDGYASMGELMFGLADYFAFYNGKRPHQSQENRTPDAVYQSAIGGGAMIVDKFPRAVSGSAAQLQVKLNVPLKLTA